MATLPTKFPTPKGGFTFNWSDDKEFHTKESLLAWNESNTLIKLYCRRKPKLCYNVKHTCI